MTIHSVFPVLWSIPLQGFTQILGHLLSFTEFLKYRTYSSTSLRALLLCTLWKGSFRIDSHLCAKSRSCLLQWYDFRHYSFLERLQDHDCCLKCGLSLQMSIDFVNKELVGMKCFVFPFDWTHQCHYCIGFYLHYLKLATSRFPFVKHC